MQEFKKLIAVTQELLKEEVPAELAYTASVAIEAAEKEVAMLERMDVMTIRMPDDIRETAIAVELIRRYGPKVVIFSTPKQLIHADRSKLDKG